MLVEIGSAPYLGFLIGVLLGAVGRRLLIGLRIPACICSVRSRLVLLLLTTSAAAVALAGLLPVLSGRSVGEVRGRVGGGVHLGGGHGGRRWWKERGKDYGEGGQGRRKASSSVWKERETQTLSSILCWAVWAFIQAQTMSACCDCDLIIFKSLLKFNSCLDELVVKFSTSPIATSIQIKSHTRLKRTVVVPHSIVLYSM